MRRHAERQHGAHVDGPSLLLPLVDADKSVDAAFERSEHPVSGRASVAVDPGEIAAEQRCRDGDDGDEREQLSPGGGVHHKRSGNSRAITR